MPKKEDDIYCARMAAVRKCFSKWQVDGILFSSMSNICYLSGFDGSDGVLILSAKNAVLLVDGRYATQAMKEAHPSISVNRYTNKIQGIKKAFGTMDVTSVGFEAAFATVEFHEALRRECKSLKFMPLIDEFWLLRASKDATEILLMKKAAAIASQAIHDVISQIRPGWTELETAFALEMAARQRGAQQIAFETIIASGQNAALPHAKPTNRRINIGDFVVMDFGVKYRGYCSDETCTVAIGELTGDKKNAYRAVLQAHDEAIASLSAGVAAADVDRLVRKVLGKKYNRFFVHGTGHGVGLDVHEAPRLAPQSPDILRTGMVVTVEPGLYYPGQWGIRIEDTVLVKKNSCEVITKMNKQLIIIE